VTKFLVSLVALAVLTACGPVETHRSRVLDGETIQVVATIGMITDAVERIGGDRVAVEGLMGPGIDPHLYKASEGDLRRLERADVIFYGGLHLEAKMADVLERIGEQRATRAVTDGIRREQLLRPAAFAGAYDPHVWFDVRLWIRAVETVRNELMELDPKSARLYLRNSNAYVAELEALDAYARQQAARVPPDRRVIITAHDAFSYFGRAYGFEVRGLQGISTAAEAGAGDVQDLVDFIVERRIPTVFVESSVSPRTIQAVREAVRSRGFDLEIGGHLYSDAMGDEGTPDGTYIGMVRHNVDAIVAGLRGDGVVE
jgi:manganese/zinc/iron transport system substrate-binding protein